MRPLKLFGGEVRTVKNQLKQLAQEIGRLPSPTRFVLKASLLVLALLVMVTLLNFYLKTRDPFYRICSNLYDAELIDDQQACIANPEQMRDFPRINKIFPKEITNKATVRAGMEGFQVTFDIEYDCTNQGKTCPSNLEYAFKKRPLILFDTIVIFNFENDVLVNIRWSD